MKKCRWDYWEVYDMFKTECGHDIDVSETSADWQFCPYCGEGIELPEGSES